MIKKAGTQDTESNKENTVQKGKNERRKQNEDYEQQIVQGADDKLGQTLLNHLK